MSDIEIGIKGLQKVVVIVPGVLKTEGKSFQRSQGIGMGR